MQLNFTLQDVEKAALELLIRCSCELPPDVHETLKKNLHSELPGSQAENNLLAILKNVDLAAKQRQPICQDTGFPLFHIEHPQQISVRALRHAVEKALIQATAQGYLRPNAVDALTEINSENNCGREFPQFRFFEHDAPFVRIRCMLKGGGSENVSAQYSLPDIALGADRNLSGVARCVLDAVYRAQGKGCAPGIIGIAIGGDRAASFIAAKEQLFRKLDDKNPVPELEELEEKLYRELNQLFIGPMGLGGSNTVLGVKATALHRHPACYFVSVAYMCWACRRAEICIGGER